jgi:hypothetical protein
MVESSDWRLAGQEAYLAGATLKHCRYRRSSSNPKWDHDHCEFCWKKFVVTRGPEVSPMAFATLDEYRWICEACFADFRAQFRWVVDGNASDE